MDLDAVLARRPAGRHRRRDRAHQRARLAQPQALPGRARAARRGHQRDRRPQRAAPGVPQRPRRAGHRRGVRETVPDSFLKQADQVVNLDLAVEDLRPAAGGKIYAPDKIPWALEHFFKDRNLATLRELALREVAESLDRAASRAVARRARRQPAAGTGDGLPLVDPPRAPALLRRGSRMAGRLNTDWFVVYVETPDEAPRPHRRRGAAPPARQHREGARAGRRGGAAQGRRPGRGAARLRALARRRPHHRRPLRAPPGGGSCSAARSCSGWWTKPEGLDLHIVSFEEEEPRMSLRAKLLLALAPLALVLVVLGMVSVQTIAQPRRRLAAHPQGQLPQRARRPAA